MSTKRSTNTRKRQQRRYLKSTIARRDRVLLEYRWREQSLCDKRSCRSHSARFLLWGLTPFYQTQDWVSFRESSPNDLNFPDSESSPSIPRNRDRVNSFVRILFSTLGWNPNFIPKNLRLTYTTLGDEIWITICNLEFGIQIHRN